MVRLALLLAATCLPGITWDPVPEAETQPIHYHVRGGFDASDYDYDGTITYDEVIWSLNYYTDELLFCPTPRDGQYYCVYAHNSDTGAVSEHCSKVIRIVWSCLGILVCQNPTWPDVACDSWEEPCWLGAPCRIPTLECRQL